MSEILPSFSSGKEALDYAHQHRMASPQRLELAVPAFKEAAHLFAKEGRRRQAMLASSWCLSLRRKLDDKGANYEQDLLQFLEEYQDFSGERGYLFCELNYLMQISLRSQQEEDYPTTAAVLPKLADLAETHRDMLGGISREQMRL